MKALWDTHAFLWWIADDPRLSSRVRAVAGNSRTDLLFSAASGWEIAIKARIGKLRLPDDPQRYLPDQLARNATRLLPIQLAHALRVFTLPDLHADPFDRMLVAQAQVEGLPILTADPQIARYPVEVIW